MAYSTEVPDDYDRKFVLPYDRNNIIDEDLINATNEISNIQQKYIYSEEDLVISKPTVRYNPLFSPSDLIDHAIHIERYKSPDENKSEHEKKEKLFDPYLNFLKEKGLINDSSELRYKLEYVNIDSGNRKKEPYNIFKDYFELSSLNFKILDNKFIIKVSSPNFYINQKISLEGLQPLVKKYNYKYGNNFIKFIQNSPYVEINTNGNLVYDSNLYYKIDTNKLYVELNNIEGNNLSSYIGNIPISLLNKIHRMYLITDTDISGNSNKFYIKLPINSDGTQAQTNFYLTVKFYHYNCIPINEINSNYPINNDHLNGYQIITNITDTEIYFLTNPPINQTNITGITYENFPDYKIYLNTIDSINKGYPNSHTYSIDLPKTYSNIVQIRMLSSVFPNVFKQFKGFPSLQQNNKLYFQDVDNGDNIQYVELEEGTYTDSEFISRMEYKFSLLTRTIDIENSSYDPYYYVKINIEKSRDYIEFKNFRRALLSRPIIGVNPTINVIDTTIGVGSYTVTINHPNHKITNVGTSITLVNFIEHLGISAVDLNKTYKIKNIIDDNTYQIVIDKINLEITKNLTNGGFACEILVPREFRLLFTYPDSMGDQLGFRNVGQSYSITYYNTIITNKEPYENETSYDVLRNQKIFTNNLLTFYRDQYIIMTCKELEIIKNTRQPIDIFGKINLSNNSSDLLIDSIICPPIFYYNPINRLSKLTFEFYTPDGIQFDFNNIDHSFVLEFTMMDNIPENTGLLSNNSNAR
jgi:hypothetical protein